MKKNIAIIGTGLIDPALTDYFSVLRDNDDLNFTIFTDSDRTLNKFKAIGIAGKGFWLPNLDGKITIILFVVFLPVWYFLTLFFALYLKLKNTQTVICLHHNEKILLTPLAKIFGLKNIWLECPDIEYAQMHKIIKKLFIFFSRQAKLITFFSTTRKQLINVGVKTDLITEISPGIKLNNYQRQENIFSKIASTERTGRNSKFFNLATVTDMSGNNKLETMFKSVKNCLSVIPNLQLIIIGDGPDKKNLTWLAKKMEIDNLVWFVGQQNFLRKWLDTVHIYIYTDDTVRLQALSALLYAMWVGLPVIGPKDIGLDDIIYENKNGYLVGSDDNEDWAQAIIKLRQNRRLYQIMSENSKAVAENFSVYKSVEKIKEYI